MAIPDYTQDQIFHNLPIPDFDETGYLGREQKVRELVKLCLGTYPVISIVGEGGIGKTALALKVVYEILDLPNCPFDGIVWTTSKTTQLTPNEITRIEGAIHDSFGMLQEIAKSLSGVDEANPFDEILEYLREFKILLILDNLETVLDDRIRTFLERLPLGSKILITSRIGLGAFEYPFRLEGLAQHEAIQLFRALAKIRQVDSLFKVSNMKISQFCNRMKNNPGYIKWFVSAVQAGSRPEDVLRQSDLFLDFCMSNVYNYLGENARNILRSMLCLSGAYSQAELAYINNYDALTLQSSIHDLLRTNMAIMSTKQVGSSIETRYELSLLARDYLSKNHPVDQDDYQVYLKRKRQLVAAGEKFDAAVKENPYSPKSIKMRSRRDLVIAKTLLDVLKLSDDGEYETGETLIAEAKRLAPEYFEVYRVEAYLKICKNNYSGAQTSYEGAVELESKYAPLQRWYGLFLLKYLDDVQGALERFENAKRLDPESELINLDIARCYLYLCQFDDAINTVETVIKSENQSLIIMKIAYDLYFQCFYRRADVAVENNDYESAIDSLSILQKVYEACPVIHKDSRTLKLDFGQQVTALTNAKAEKHLEK